MRANPFIILGAPIASWALFASLVASGVANDTSGLVAVSWGACWLVLGLIGRVPEWVARRPITAQRYASSRAQRFFGAAVTATLLMPLPVYAITAVLDGLHLVSTAVCLPLFSMLGAPVPIALWYIALRPATAHDEEQMVPLGFRRYEASAPAGVIPPRLSQQQRHVA